MLAPDAAGHDARRVDPVTGLPQGLGPPPDGGPRRRPTARSRLWVHTDWVMTDTVRGLPGRVPRRVPGRVRRAARRRSSRAACRCPPTPDDAAVTRPRVRPQDVDPMGHVNNAAYIDYLEEALLAAGTRRPGRSRRPPRGGSGSSTVARRARGRAWSGELWPVTAPTSRAGRADGRLGLATARRRRRRPRICRAPGSTPGPEAGAHARVSTRRPRAEWYFWAMTRRRSRGAGGNRPRTGDRRMGPSPHGPAGPSPVGCA